MIHAVYDLDRRAFARALPQAIIGTSLVDCSRVASFRLSWADGVSFAFARPLPDTVMLLWGCHAHV